MTKISLTVRFLAFVLVISSFADVLSQNINTAKIGNQIWMKKNLNIPVDSSFCYNNNDENCKVFGRLYNWETALTVCPDGFRLPTDEDWNELVSSVGGLKIAGYKLMMGGETGFDILLGGNYNASSDIFSYQFRHAYFWTATPFSETAAWMRNFINGKTNINRSTVKKEYFFSVRCIKN